MDYSKIIKEIGRGAKGARSLGANEAEALFGAMLDGRVPELELGAIVMALRIKSESLDELLGFARALAARTPPVDVPAGPHCVVLPSYNGARRQANLMPLVALLLQRAGVPVLIHGRHDFESRVSPFELLAALDIHPVMNATAAGRELAAGRIACLRLSEYLPGLDRLLALRLRMGVRGSAHTVAKLLDPCPGRSVRVVAVTHPEYLERMHDFLLADGGRAMLLRGSEGEIYANPRRRPALQAFAEGRGWLAREGEEGGAPPLEGLPDTPAVADNAALIRAMLDGRLPIPHPILDQVEVLQQLAQPG